MPLTKADAATGPRSLLWKAARRPVSQKDRGATRVQGTRVLKDGKLEMPFFYKTFGKKPAAGWSLWISLHGGGGAPKGVNDGSGRTRRSSTRSKKGSISRRAHRPTPGTSGTRRTSTACSAGSSKT